MEGVDKCFVLKVEETPQPSVGDVTNKEDSVKVKVSKSCEVKLTLDAKTARVVRAAIEAVLCTCDDTNFHRYVDTNEDRAAEVAKALKEAGLLIPRP